MHPPTPAVSTTHTPPEQSTGPTTSTNSHQVAGHPGQLILLSSGILAKQCTQKEISFYESAQTPQYSSLRPFLPTYHGHGTINASGKESLCVHIENLLTPFTHPCIADVKIGTRLYGDEADEDKRKRMEEQARTTTSFDTGMRICGMKIHDPLTGEDLVHDKTFGRSLTPTTLHLGFLEFFQIPSTKQLIPRTTITQIRDRITRLCDILKTHECRLYASSVLLIYEGGVDSTRVDVRLIDFAHAQLEDGAGVDEGAIFGLNNMIGILDGLVDEREGTKGLN